ncbi:glycosyltransferase family 1 protein [Tetragenococcus halophilus]|uniref:glycosyltransferase family 1 protein n=1 Tax=Tetragenococcus halophilus TaxID=51669 RepID=UPI001B70B30C|nr:glycosyltransferase family 1 protein [Tetragenococcus halophilus]GFK28222.1 glycosyl transferase [Tetragenococcus halophilus]
MSKGIKVLRIMGSVVSGGVDVITMNYYRNIDRNKVQLDFVFDGFRETNIEKEIESTGGTVYKVEPYMNNIFKNMKQIYKIVKDNNYQIVHSHMNSLSVFPLMAAKLAGAQIRIASNHSTATLKEFKRSIFKYLLKPFATVFPTHLAACSRHAAIWLFGKRRTNAGKVKLIKNAIDLDNYKYSANVDKEVRKELGVSEDTFIVGHVGRFVTQKNHHFIIEVFESILEKQPNSVLLLIGDGQLKQEIQALVTKKKLNSKVKFLGIRKDINKLMQAMDVFLFPSLYEGLGNVVTEAQAASTVSIISDKVPNEVKITEYVIEMSLKQNADAWAEKAVTFSSNYERRDTSSDLKEQGYEIKSAAKEVVSYYQNLYTTIRKDGSNT